MDVRKKMSFCDLVQECIRHPTVASDIINNDWGAWCSRNNQTTEEHFTGGTLWMSIFHMLIMMPCVFDYVRTSAIYLEAYQELQPEVLAILTE